MEKVETVTLDLEPGASELCSAEARSRVGRGLRATSADDRRQCLVMANTEEVNAGRRARARC